MPVVRLAAGSAPAAVLALPVQARGWSGGAEIPAGSGAGQQRSRPAPAPDTGAGTELSGVAGTEPSGLAGAAGTESGTLAETAAPISEALATESAALLRQTAHTGRPGLVQSLPRPTGRLGQSGPAHHPRLVLLVGIGNGDEPAWRAAGAAIARAAVRETSVVVAPPLGIEPAAVRGLVEGLLLASYRFRLGADAPGGGGGGRARQSAAAPRLRRVTLALADPERFQPVLDEARAVAEATCFARDLTNTPSLRKNPSWFVRQVQKAAAPLAGVGVRDWDDSGLREAGFGGITAVGAGSASPPRLLELDWRPRPAATTHVVLVGKGITFDTGGVSIKTSANMKLMRKDMGGAAAVVAATLAAARLRLPVRVTALAPLAENMVSGSALRPGDVIRHWGGKTSEIRNTDAEGRLVVADALAYAAARLRPDLLLDLATLTGANAVALGKRTGALYSDDDGLAAALADAAEAAGERVWRMPLVDDYREALGSEIADLNNAPDGGAGSVMAALYLREFTGATRLRRSSGAEARTRRRSSRAQVKTLRWAHIDMSAPSWADQDDRELSRGATGWGVRTLLRFLASLG